MKPIVPTKETGTAASRLTSNMISSRKRRTSMPKLAALSSPSRSVVSAQARRRKKGRVKSRTAVVMPSLCQFALVREPIVQNTTAPSACSEAKNCSSESSALKVKTSAMPSRITVSVVTPRCWLSTWISIAAPMAMMKALIGTM